MKEKFHSENFTLYLRDIIEKRNNKKEKFLIKYKSFSGFIATNEEKTEQIKIFHFVQWCPSYMTKRYSGHMIKIIYFILNLVIQKIFTLEFRRSSTSAKICAGCTLARTQTWMFGSAPLTPTRSAAATMRQHRKSL